MPSAPAQTATRSGVADAFAIAVGRFYEDLADRLVAGATRVFQEAGASVEVHDVPGAFELPLAAQRIAASGEVDAIVCLGAVIRGETAHFDFVASHSMNGIGQAALATGVPITCGVLTTENTEQAADRAGGKLGNKGFEAALAALEMANLFAELPKPQSDL